MQKPAAAECLSVACQLPSLYMVVCAGTINFVVVPNANRIGPIESDVFKIVLLCDGSGASAFKPIHATCRNLWGQKDRATILETKALKVGSS